MGITAAPAILEDHPSTGRKQPKHVVRKMGYWSGKRVATEWQRCTAERR
jgi:hypothetical protein